MASCGCRNFFLFPITVAMTIYFTKQQSSSEDNPTLTYTSKIVRATFKQPVPKKIANFLRINRALKRKFY